MITILKDEQFKTALLDAINGATREILISTYKMNYKDRTATRHLNAIVQALYRASLRGVRVKCLLNMDSEHSSIGRINMKTKGLLEEKGILVKTGPKGRSYHTKLIIIDETLAIVGSHNMSESSLCRNFEISLMIDHPTFHFVPSDREICTLLELRRIYLRAWERGE